MHACSLTPSGAHGAELKKKKGGGGGEVEKEEKERRGMGRRWGEEGEKQKKSTDFLPSQLFSNTLNVGM